jgi:hypothetical protein
VIGHSRVHRRGTRPPYLRCTTAVGDFGDQQRLAQTGVRQHEIVLDVKQGSLLPQTCFALAEGVHPAPDRRHTLPEVEVEALDKSRVDGPAGFAQKVTDCPVILCRRGFCTQSLNRQKTVFLLVNISGNQANSPRLQFVLFPVYLLGSFRP